MFTDLVQYLRLQDEIYGVQSTNDYHYLAFSYVVKFTYGEGALRAMLNALNGSNKDTPLYECYEKCYAGKEPGSANIEDNLFDCFWFSYPASRRVGKNKAKQKFLALSVDKMQEAIKKVERTCELRWNQMEENGEGEFIPHPATWLNQRLDDDVEMLYGNK